MTQKEKNNKVIAAASTVGMYVVLFLILLFTVAWRTPYPPIPGGSGVSLILGTDDFGSGEVPDEPIGTQEPEQKKEETPQQEQPKEEVKPQPQEEDKDVVTSTEESPVTVKKDDKKKEEKKKEEVKPIEPEKVKETPKKEEPQQPKTVYNPNKNTSTADNKTGTPGSKGDDEGKTGDKGDPRGTPGGAVYKGNPGVGGDGPGGSGGTSLDMAGWEWVEKPEVPRTSEEDQFSGQVTFVFDVDDIGAVGNIKKESGNLSFALEQKCREALKKTSFYKTSAGDAPPRTTGRVTFRLRVQ